MQLNSATRARWCGRAMRPKEDEQRQLANDKNAALIDATRRKGLIRYAYLAEKNFPISQTVGVHRNRINNHRCMYRAVRFVGHTNRTACLRK